jgi:hypothetical protein
MPEKFKRCVEHVKGQKGVRSAYAICTAANAGNIKQVRKQEAAAKKSHRYRRAHGEA